MVDVDPRQNVVGHIMDDADDSDGNQSDDAFALHTALGKPHRGGLPACVDAQGFSGTEDRRRGIRTRLLNRIGCYDIPPRERPTDLQDRLSPAELNSMHLWDHVEDRRPSIRGGLSTQDGRNYPAAENPLTASPNHLPPIAVTIARNTGNTRPPSKSLRSRFSRYFRTKRRTKHAKAQGLTRGAPQALSQGRFQHA